MAEPVVLYPEGCAPCRDHDTLPTVTYYAWRSPSYEVACPRAHAIPVQVYGATLAEAQATWNARNAPPSVPAATPLTAQTEAELAPYITSAFLDLLVAAVRVYGWCGDYDAVQDFVQWCLALHGDDTPVELSPLAIEDPMYGGT